MVKQPDSTAREHDRGTGSPGRPAAHRASRHYRRTGRRPAAGHRPAGRRVQRVAAPAGPGPPRHRGRCSLGRTSPSACSPWPSSRSPSTRGILIEVLIALFIAVSLDPAVVRLNRWGVRRGWAVWVILTRPASWRASCSSSRRWSTSSRLIQRLSGYAKTSRNGPELPQDQRPVSPGPPRSRTRWQASGKVSTGDHRHPPPVRRAVLHADRGGPDPSHGPTSPAAAVGRTAVPKAHRAKVAKITDVMVDKVGDYMIGNLAISSSQGSRRSSPSPRWDCRSPCRWASRWPWST